MGRVPGPLWVRRALQSVPWACLCGCRRELANLAGCLPLTYSLRGDSCPMLAGLPPPWAAGFLLGAPLGSGQCPFPVVCTLRSPPPSPQPSLWRRASGRVWVGGRDGAVRSRGAHFSQRQRCLAVHGPSPWKWPWQAGVSRRLVSCLGRALQRVRQGQVLKPQRLLSYVSLSLLGV